jgi:hypothetical protein
MISVSAVSPVPISVWPAYTHSIPAVIRHGLAVSAKAIAPSVLALAPSNKPTSHRRCRKDFNCPKMHDRCDLEINFRRQILP